MTDYKLVPVEMALPCPFCGSSNIGNKYIETYSTDSSYDTFGCKDCGARFEDGCQDDWNRRAAPAVQGEPVGYARPHQLEALLSGKVCGITMEDKPDAHNRVTVPLYAAPAPADRNQCDGCQSGIPVENGMHRMGKSGGYPDMMACTAHLYAPAVQGEPVAWVHPEQLNVLTRAQDTSATCSVWNVPGAMPSGTSLRVPLYAAPQPAEQQALKSSLALDASVHLTNWLNMSLCECEGGHTCGYNDVMRTRDALLEAAEQPECGCCAQTTKCDDDCDAKQTAPDVAGLVSAAEFLLHRLREMEDLLVDDELCRNYLGHVAPAIARFEGLVAAHRLKEPSHDNQ